MVRATDGTPTAKNREPIESCREGLIRLARLLGRYQGPTGRSDSGRTPAGAATILDALHPKAQVALHGLLSKLNDWLEAILVEAIPSSIPSGIMQIELRCTHCPCSFAASPETPFAEVMERMKEEGPWFALANGETLEDMIWGALLARGAIYCPECGKPVSVREYSLGSLLDTFAPWDSKDRIPKRPKRRS